MIIKEEIMKQLSEDPQIYLNAIEIDPSKIKAIMINEVVPASFLRFTGCDLYGDHYSLVPKGWY